MGWLKLTQWGRWSREVCPVANSRLWPRLAGSIHRRALRDRFTNPPLPTSTPSLPFSLSLPPPFCHQRPALPSRTRLLRVQPSFLPSFLSREVISTGVASPIYPLYRYFERVPPLLGFEFLPLPNFSTHDTPTRSLRLEVEEKRR